MNTDNQTLLTIDSSVLDNELEALAKITEALAKVYFNNVLKKGYNIAPISNAYSIAFNLCPNYRLFFKDQQEIYKNLTIERALITALPIYKNYNHG